MAKINCCDPCGAEKKLTAAKWTVTHRESRIRYSVCLAHREAWKGSSVIELANRVAQADAGFNALMMGTVPS